MARGRVIGAKVHADRIKRLHGQRMVTEVGKALFVAGQGIELDMELSITEGSVSGKGHVPSRPGEPPSADTRQLDGSIHTTQPQELRVEVVVNDPKGVYLENGTSKMAARPFAGPAGARGRPKATALVSKAVQRVNRQAGGG